MSRQRLVGRAKTVLTDRASWRDLWWLLVHSTVGCVARDARRSRCLRARVFYLIYPFLYWVTPDSVFRQPFGFFTLHSVGQSFALMPLASSCLRDLVRDGAPDHAGRTPG